MTLAQEEDETATEGQVNSYDIYSPDAGMY